MLYGGEECGSGLKGGVVVFVRGQLFETGLNPGTEFAIRVEALRMVVKNPPELVEALGVGFKLGEGGVHGLALMGVSC